MLLRVLNTFDVMPSMNETWSKPVVQTPLPGEPRNCVGVNAPNVGSNEPVSTKGSVQH